MVTDSWTHARELVRRLLARTGSGPAALADLDDARNRLLTAEAAQGEQAASDVTAQWQAQLRRLVAAGQATGDDLRALLTSLRQLSDASAARGDTTHNHISGGVQHGPVIQTGRISELTFPTHRSSDRAEGGGRAGHRTGRAAEPDG
ncbi:hypothetical protein [Streptomyces sp. NPDC056160]|uniref:hypothetical protein n=1 Tax=Streptomyces sp. NPDC056160 TaxID=3345731 RepID=UPI0035D9F7AE